MGEHFTQKVPRTKEHKQKISNANLGINKNTIYITNGKIVKRIPPELLDEYKEKGFRKGRKLDGLVWIPWNKGKTSKA